MLLDELAEWEWDMAGGGEGAGGGGGDDGKAGRPYWPETKQKAAKAQLPRVAASALAGNHRRSLTAPSTDCEIKVQFRADKTRQSVAKLSIQRH